jgi:hypothetical protein
MLQEWNKYRGVCGEKYINEHKKKLSKWQICQRV